MKDSQIKQLAKLCYYPKSEGDVEFAMQLFIEKTVLPPDCKGYTDEDMEDYIKKYLEK